MVQKCEYLGAWVVCFWVDYEDIWYDKYGECGGMVIFTCLDLFLLRFLDIFLAFFFLPTILKMLTKSEILKKF